MPYVPTIKRRRLGGALRRQREQAGYTTERAAAGVGWSQSKVSRVETAAIAVSPANVRTLLELYGAPSGEIAELVGLAVEDRQPAWWRQYSDVLSESFTGYLSLESDASCISAYESELVPGLLQIDPYARAVLAQHPLTVMPYEIDQATKLLLGRQARLGGDAPLQLDVVVNEGALQRSVGGPEVMRAQLAHLVETGAKPNVTLQVLPFGAGAHSATHGSFLVLEFPDEADPRIACLDLLATTLFREGPREVGAYQLAHERLKALALGPEESSALITRLVEESRS